MIEDRVDHLLVAMDDVEQAVGKAGFLHQFGEADWNRRVAFGWLQDEGVAAGDRHSEHPHRNHRREVERSDAGADAERLAHRIDVDAGTCAVGIFALQRLRNAASIFDDFKAALDVALRIGDDLAMLAGKELRQLLHVRLDQFLELEHDPGATLRVGGGPGGLCIECGIDRFLEGRGGTEIDLGLDFALRWVPDIAAARAVGDGLSIDEMFDATHWWSRSLLPDGEVGRSLIPDGPYG